MTLYTEIHAQPKPVKKKKIKQSNKDLYAEIHKRDCGMCLCCGDRVPVGSVHHILGRSSNKPEDLISLGWQGGCRDECHFVYHHVSPLKFIELAVKHYGIKLIVQFIMRGMINYTQGIK